MKKSILKKFNNYNNITLDKNTIDNKSIENSRLANLLTTKEILLLKPLEQKKELSDNISNIYDDKLPDFTEHLPKWGAKFSFGRSLVTVVNTCTIDNYLFALWFLSKIEIKLIENIPESSKSLILKQIIEKIDSLERDRARQLWHTLHNRLLCMYLFPNSVVLLSRS